MFLRWRPENWFADDDIIGDLSPPVHGRSRQASWRGRSFDSVLPTNTSEEHYVLLVLYDHRQHTICTTMITLPPCCASSGWAVVRQHAALVRRNEQGCWLFLSHQTGGSSRSSLKYETLQVIGLTCGKYVVFPMRYSAEQQYKQCSDGFRITLQTTRLLTAFR